MSQKNHQTTSDSGMSIQSEGVKTNISTLYNIKLSRLKVSGSPVSMTGSFFIFHFPFFAFPD